MPARFRSLAAEALVMAKDPVDNHILAELNEQQATAVRHGDGPLLIVAGAGTGKTRTLVHRVAHLIQRGVDPRRILLLTFTRRAAGEMLRRVDALLGSLEAGGKKRRRLPAGQRVWGGTFHATAARLLRIHGRSIGLDPGFTIHDRSDSEDLLNAVRTELDLAKTDRRFPKKRTCLAIYSHCVNAQVPLEEVLERHHRWCVDYDEELRSLFQAYVDRKDALTVLDYDDLLLFWLGALDNQTVAERIRERFDCVLVDEYQDTNRLQAEILRGLCPNGQGMTVVGDDAQSIYSFRAATVRNILDFPALFPGTTIVRLEENYRSTQPILDATNRVIAEASEGHAKTLFSRRTAGEKPQLIMCEDEYDQADAVIQQALTHCEAGIELRCQAVLFRASHHSLTLESELLRHNIPFVKYGGLKFVEAAHVKDVMAYLRLAENPRDIVAATRLLLLLPGVGPKRAQQWTAALAEGPHGFRAWEDVKPPAASRVLWPELVKLLKNLHDNGDMDLTQQVSLVREFYTPLLLEKYDNPPVRLRDIEQMEEMVARFASRQDMLADMALDPPASTEDFAGPSDHDEDYLVLSTVHSAKGLEWDAVYVLGAVDGNIPAGMALNSPEQIEEERRLFYVALTRAKNWLYVYFPRSRPRGWRGLYGDQHGYAQLTRFITPKVRERFECGVASVLENDDDVDDDDADDATDIRKRSRSMWSY
jgi:DNA helicase-2/ATP-dependent DNA helicase PcrA